MADLYHSCQGGERLTYTTHILSSYQGACFVVGGGLQRGREGGMVVLMMVIQFRVHCLRRFLMSQENVLV